MELLLEISNVCSPERKVIFSFYISIWITMMVQMNSRYIIH